MADERHAPDPPQPRAARPVSRSANEARQGQIILGRRGRWLWIAVFALLVVLALLFGV